MTTETLPFEKLAFAIDTLIGLRLDWIAANPQFDPPTHSAIAYNAHSRDYLTIVVEPGQRSGKTLYAVGGTQYKFPIMQRHERAIEWHKPFTEREIFSFEQLLRNPQLLAGHRALFVDDACSCSNNDLFRIRECAMRVNPSLLLIMLGVPGQFALAGAPA